MQHTGPINISRDVKQGDLLSPILFNLVIDELLDRIPPELGLEFGEVRVPALAYGDDLVLMAPSTREANKLLNITKRFLEKRGLDLNAAKCSSLQANVVPAMKKLFAVTKPRFYIDGVPIGQVGLNNFKYLGIITPATLASLPGLLAKIKRAPLKPHQKWLITRDYLVPRYIHGPRNPRINKKTLRKVEKLFRMHVKTILYLPVTAITAYLHAPVKLGGLGLFNFERRIPAILAERIAKFQFSESEQICPP